MYRNRNCFFIALVILLIIVQGNTFFTKREYICKIDDVQSVQIAILEGFNAEEYYSFEYEILHEVKNLTTFIQQLNSVEQTVNYGEPIPLEVGSLVVKIDYFNGDCDLLYHNAQILRRFDKNQTGYYIFNKKQLDALVSDYLNDASINSNTENKP